MPASQGELFEAGILFGPNFIRDHAGQLMTEPRLAVIELVANAYDAGATRVDIDWPTERGNEFRIEDNGTGMTREEFAKRWRTLNYRRVDEQGPAVTFPPGARQKGRRLAFGQSGKGRHSAFCFSDKYEVDTWRDGKCTHVTVMLTDGESEPFEFAGVTDDKKQGHGTLVRATVERNHIATEELVSAIGSKFLVEPNFAVHVNRQVLQLLKLPFVSTASIALPNLGEVKVHEIDPGQSDRTTHLRGITWWVNHRRVGNPSWDGLDEQGAILDGRKAEAKRLSFVVEADLLKPDVKDDWSGFAASERLNQVQRAVREHVTKRLDALLSQSRLTRKRQALAETAEVLGELPGPSRRAIGAFTDEVIQKCPSITAGDLARTVQVFATMEKARSGYNLLVQLAECSPDDLDRWNSILERWTASDAESVLNELSWRLEVVAKLELLITREKADELHDLQPLFERGLWMFGPEFEAVDFRSNRSLANVIRDYFDGKVESRDARRPDFVALADRSIGTYAADSFDARGEVWGIGKVLIVELKHAGATLTRVEVAQPEVYVARIRSANVVQERTKFEVFVLGAFLADDAVDDRKIGDYLLIHPMQYERLLARARARTFHLLDKVKSAFPDVQHDPDVEAVVETKGSTLFTQPTFAP